MSSSSFSFKDRTSAPIRQHISQDRVCQTLFACPLSYRAGPEKEIWGNLDGHIIIIRRGKNLINQENKWDKPFIESLGGDVGMKKGSSLKYRDGKPSVSCASFFSRKYHLTINYSEGNPIQTNVLPDEEASLEVKVWD